MYSSSLSTDANPELVCVVEEGAELSVRAKLKKKKQPSIANTSGGNELSRRVSVTLRDVVRSTAIEEPIEVTRMPPR